MLNGLQRRGRDRRDLVMEDWLIASLKTKTTLWRDRSFAWNGHTWTTTLTGVELKLKSVLLFKIAVQYSLSSSLSLKMASNKLFGGF